MNTYQDCWAQNDNIRIHYLKKGQAKPGQYPLVASLGIWEPAERAIPLFEKQERQCIALSYRGRGKSDTPEQGYDLEDHVGDLAAVIKQENLDKFYMLAFSRGVPYALGYILSHLEQIAGLILVDQPPLQNKWPHGNAEFWKNLVYLGQPVANSIRPQALDCIEREARRVEFWNDLGRIECPVMILRGTSAEAKIPSDLSQENASRYLRGIKDAREVRFEHSGHMIPDEEPEKYAETVGNFWAELDRRTG